MATAPIREQLTTAYVGQAQFASLHTANPGENGSFELAATGRKALTWTTGSGGSASAAPVLFDVPDNTDVTHVGIWTAATGGTFVDSVPAAVTFATAGQYSVGLTYQQS